MAWWEWLVEAAALILVLLLAYALALVLRRRALARHGGTFEMSCRVREVEDGRGWLVGVGRYAGEELQFFRFFSLSPRPKRVWSRARLRFAERRSPVGTEQVSLYVDHVVVSCESPEGAVELAMNPSSLTGFQAWLEARPPGTDWDH